jgi:ubiquinone biosynthesis protein
MSEHMGPRAFIRTLRNELPKWWAMLPEIPALAHENLRRAGQGGSAEESRTREIEQLRRQLRRQHRRLYFAIAGSGLLIAGTVMLGMDVTLYGEVSWGRVLGWVLAAMGGFMLLRGWSEQIP